MRFNAYHLILAALIASALAECPQDYTFAVLTDVHIGENSDCVRPILPTFSID